MLNRLHAVWHQTHGGKVIYNVFDMIVDVPVFGACFLLISIMSGSMSAPCTAATCFASNTVRIRIARDIKDFHFWVRRFSANS